MVISKLKIFNYNISPLILSFNARILKKIQPRKNYIHFAYHHFWEHAKQVLIHLLTIKLQDNAYDILTKSLFQTSFWNWESNYCTSYAYLWSLIYFQMMVSEKFHLYFMFILRRSNYVSTNGIWFKRKLLTANKIWFRHKSPSTDHFSNKKATTNVYVILVNSNHH